MWLLFFQSVVVFIENDWICEREKKVVKMKNIIWRYQHRESPRFCFKVLESQRALRGSDKKALLQSVEYRKMKWRRNNRKNISEETLSIALYKKTLRLDSRKKKWWGERELENLWIFLVAVKLENMHCYLYTWTNFIFYSCLCCLQSSHELEKSQPS